MAGSDSIQPDFELLQRVMALAASAGEVILSFYVGVDKLQVDTKEDFSPVTIADRAANQLLEARLPELLPLPLLSEESFIPPYSERSSWQRYWLVDPLDGTREFLSGTGDFTVNIALIESGRPVLGVVYVPVSGVGYGGLQGVGAWRHINEQWEPISVRSMAGRISAGEPLKMVASRRHGGGTVTRLRDFLVERFGEVVLQPVGSSLKQCLVAEGAADIYPHFWPTSEWDTAAGQAVVEAAGGAFLDIDFRPLRYNSKPSLLNPHFYVIADRNYGWAAELSAARRELK